MIVLDQVCMSACELPCAGFKSLGSACICKPMSSGVKVIGAAHLLADSVTLVLLWLDDAAAWVSCCGPATVAHGDKLRVTLCHRH